MREKEIVDAFMFWVGFVLMVIATLIKGLAHKKNLDGSYLLLQGETRGFLNGISFVIYSISLVLLGVWYGANYIN